MQRFVLILFSIFPLILPAQAYADREGEARVLGRAARVGRANRDTAVAAAGEFSIVTRPWASMRSLPLKPGLIRRRETFARAPRIAGAVERLEG